MHFCIHFFKLLILFSFFRKHKKHKSKYDSDAELSDSEPKRKKKRDSSLKSSKHSDDKNGVLEAMQIVVSNKNGNAAGDRVKNFCLCMLL